MAAADPAVEILGYSPYARPISVVRRPGPLGAPRVLVVAGQHGDEPLGMESVARLAAGSSGPWKGLEVAFIACLNPDGQAHRTRGNEEGRDLNRDHLLLASPETQALHAFAQGFRPQLIVDVHTFKGRRRALRSLGGQHGADVLLGWSNYSLPIARSGERLTQAAIAAVESEGLRAGSYFVFDNRGLPRSSSIDILDARNGLAASVGALGILVEGREPTRQLGDEARTLGALMCALEAVIRAWRSRHKSLLDEPRPKVLATDLRRGPPRIIKSWILEEDAEEPLEVPVEVLTDVLHRKEVDIPRGYFVPRGSLVEEVLARHGFYPSEPPAAFTLEAGRVLKAKASTRPGEPWLRLQIDWQPESLDPRPTHAYFSTGGWRGVHLARLLEPSSRYALHRRPELGLPISEGFHHTIYRSL